jgi:hypothetical protein
MIIEYKFQDLFDFSQKLFKLNKDMNKFQKMCTKTFIGEINQKKNIADLYELHNKSM